MRHVFTPTGLDLDCDVCGLTAPSELDSESLPACPGEPILCDGRRNSAGGHFIARWNKRCLHCARPMQDL